MYIDWDLAYNQYDMVLKSWCCTQNAPGTFWAVHQWSNGYAGFQNVSSDPKIILAIWDDGSNVTTIEYLSTLADPDDINFNENGPGKHIITDYTWNVGTWYTMTVGVKSDSINNFTYYAQWVAQESVWNWKLYAIIGLPGANRVLNKSSVFQEDFAANNILREGRISNAYGHLAVSPYNWELWDLGEIRSYDPNTNEWDKKPNCNYELGTYSNGKYIALTTGSGAGTCINNLPHTFLLIVSGGTPPSIPEFPHYIKSCYSSKYVKPSTTPNDNHIIQSTTRYWWDIKSAGNGYVYILNPENTKALTISGTSNGDPLIMTPFTATDDQKWLIDNTATSGVKYICPKNAIAKSIYTTSSSDNEILKIWTQSTTSSQFKWIIFDY